MDWFSLRFVLTWDLDARSNSLHIRFAFFINTCMFRVYLRWDLWLFLVWERRNVLFKTWRVLGYIICEYCIYNLICIFQRSYLKVVTWLISGEFSLNWKVSFSFSIESDFWRLKISNRSLENWIGQLWLVLVEIIMSLIINGVNVIVLDIFSGFFSETIIIVRKIWDWLADTKRSFLLNFIVAFSLIKLAI